MLHGQGGPPPAGLPRKADGAPPLHKAAGIEIDLENEASAGGVDNEAAMLRKLLKQMADVQGEIAEVKSGMEKTSAAVTAAAQESSGRRRRTLQKNDSAADIKGTLNGD